MTTRRRFNVYGILILPSAFLASVGAWPGRLAAQSVEQVPDFSSDHRDDNAKANVEAVEDSIIAKTNALRREHSIAAVAPNEDLRAAATYFARYMADTGRYGHKADGNSPAQRVSQHGYDYCIVLENIAYRYSTQASDEGELAEAFYNGWRESPEHRRNMLDPDVSETGVAVVQDDDGVYFAVQMFGRPKSQQIEFTIRNEAKKTARYVLQTSGMEKSYELDPRVRRVHRLCRPPKLRLMKSGDSPLLKDVAGGTFSIQSTSDGDLSISRVTSKAIE